MAAVASWSGSRLSAFSLALLFLASLAVAPATASAFRVSTASATPQRGLRGGTTTGPTLRAKVKSLYEIRWENVIRQRLDVGCGAAALAMILTYYFGFPSTERELFQPLLAEAMRGAGPDVQQVGFSLRHIRDVAQKGGLAAAAFKVKLEDLDKVRIPAITRITINGYDHFVVFKEARHGRVYLADPAFGNTSYRLPAFEKIWSGVLMGFTRRMQDLPADHLLTVRLADVRSIESEELMRTAARRQAAPVAARPDFARLDTFDFLSPRIEGTRPIFPKVLVHSINLGR